MKEKKILVLGATGQQGGAAVRHLIKDGWKVRAFVRDLSSDKAKKLSQLGAELALGDMEDLATVDAAMQGMYGVFSVQPPDWSPSAESNDHEKRIGKAIVDSAKKANIQHFVYASVGGADGQAWIRDAKWEIEQYIQNPSDYQPPFCVPLPSWRTSQTRCPPVYRMEPLHKRSSQMVRSRL